MRLDPTDLTYSNSGDRHQTVLKIRKLIEKHGVDVTAFRPTAARDRSEVFGLSHPDNSINPAFLPVPRPKPPRRRRRVRR